MSRQTEHCTIPYVQITVEIHTVCLVEFKLKYALKINSVAFFIQLSFQIHTKLQVSTEKYVSG